MPFDGFATVPEFPDGRVWLDGRVWPDGRVAVGLLCPDGFAADGRFWSEGRVTVVLGLRSFEGLAEGRADEGLRSVVPDGLTVPD